MCDTGFATVLTRNIELSKYSLDATRQHVGLSIPEVLLFILKDFKYLILPDPPIMANASSIPFVLSHGAVFVIGFWIRGKFDSAKYKAGMAIKDKQHKITLAKKSVEGAAQSVLVGIAAGAVGLVMGTGFGIYLKGKLSASR
eukprot:jgi/Bigna1/73678/fgenesh1_pg.25_\